MATSDLVVILSPHFDDAVISLGGFLAQRPGDTVVLTVFAGRPSPSRPASDWAMEAGFKTSDEEVEARTRENEASLRRLGARAHNLSYLDMPYRDWILDTGLPVSIARDILEFLRSLRPRPIRLYGPAALPRSGPEAAHDDHRLVHNAFRMVVKKRLDHVRGYIYEDIPYAAATNADAREYKELLETTDRMVLRHRVLPLTPDHLQKKRASIEDYASQVRAAKKRGEDYQASAQEFARQRGSNPWARCEACEIVYEIVDPGPPDTNRVGVDGEMVDGGVPATTKRVASGAPPMVTAVMVTYRSLHSVGSALDALKPAFDSGLLRCIVVDNASIDGTADHIAREHPWVSLIRSPENLGYGRGCNLGLAQVQTPYVLVMNPDVVIQQEAIERLLQFMEAKPTAGMAAPATVFGGNSYQHVGGLPTPWSIIAGAAGIPGSQRDFAPLLPDSSPFTTDWLCGAIMFMRTKVLRELEGFDPRFFLYFEETDLCLRMRKAGHELWAVGEATAIHAGGSSVRRVNPALTPGQNLSIHFFPSRFYYLIKHHGRFAAVVTDAAELMVKALRDIARAALGKRSKNEFTTRFRAPLFTVPPKRA